MGQVHWSEPALEDLREIVSFVARDSPAYAAKLASQISKAPRILSSFPAIGSIVPELGQSTVRELWVCPYRIIYLVRGSDCHVLAIAHASRDLSGFTPIEEPDGDRDAPSAP
ncbi:MAG: type II toxin-antitoxin system RelE/ParE family toxin [Isosphaeraceae bacterium]